MEVVGPELLEPARLSHAQQCQQQQVDQHSHQEPVPAQPARATAGPARGRQAPAHSMRLYMYIIL